jgi:hypothetical protein
MPGIASAATAVALAISLPYPLHSRRRGWRHASKPRTAPIAEQFALAALHPGRIDLGPALRAAITHPRDAQPGPGRRFSTGRWSCWIISSHDTRPGAAGELAPARCAGSGVSTYGAQLAAALGLPYAFARTAPAQTRRWHTVPVSSLQNDWRASCHAWVNVFAVDTTPRHGLPLLATGVQFAAGVRGSCRRLSMARSPRAHDVGQRARLLDRWRAGDRAAGSAGFMNTGVTN